MIYYKNITNHVKRFYGIDFEPHSIHGVPGYINDSNIIRVTKPDKHDKLEKTNKPEKTSKPKEVDTVFSKKRSSKVSSLQVDSKYDDENIKEEVPDGSNNS